MNIDLAALPDDVETLQRMVRTLAAGRAEAQAEIERLRLIIQKLQRSQFGRRTEAPSPSLIPTDRLALDSRSPDAVCV